MTRGQRILSILLSAALLVSGFAFGRITRQPSAAAASESENKLAANYSQPNSAPEKAGDNQSFYLSDYKTGYSDGYQAGMTGQGSAVASSARAGYNEGFKEGYADSYKGRVKPQATEFSNIGQSFSAQPAVYRPAGYRSEARRVVYRTQPVYYRGARPRTVYRSVYRPAPVYYSRPRSRHSKLRTALTIAAPAAIGAGIGALAGGGKGAGVGALLGGGGGALYYLIKHR